MATEPRHSVPAGLRRWLRRVLLAAVVYLLGVSVYYLAVHEPNAVELDRREREGIELEKTSRDVLAAAKQPDGVRSAVSELELELRALDRILPTELPPPEDVEWLEGPAEIVQSEVVEIEDGEIEDRDFYLELPTRLHFEIGGLEHLTTFVELLESRSPLRRVTKLRLDDRGPDSIDVRLTVVHYAWKEPAPSETSSPIPSS